GRIVRQTPPAQRIVRQGRTVEVVLSRGPEVGVVPDFTGLSLREARIAVTLAGYTLGEEFDDVRDDAPANFVTGQQPAPGARAEKGTPINLCEARSAALADEAVTVPDFRGRDIEQAAAGVARRGLMAGTIGPEMNPLAPARRVLHQKPGPVAEVPEGTAVDFVYSQGLPGVAGETAEPPFAGPGGGRQPSDTGDWETLL